MATWLGKMGRKKQKLSSVSDFKSKKKKVGKGKKPVENVTEVNFKSKSIVIPPQLEQLEINGPTTHRKQSLQVLFTQMKHYSSPVRRDALIGLRDILSSHPQLLPTCLPRLVEQVFSSMVDSSGSVRQASHAFIKFFAESLADNVITPFFQTLVAHLNCGLTHINENIQLDSLKILDLYLQYHPRLLIEYTEEIIQVLIGLLSRHRTASSRSLKPVSNKRKCFIQAKSTSQVSLTSNPSSKLVNKHSRLNIFLMILKMLDAMLIAISSDAASGDLLSQRALVHVLKKQVLIMSDKGYVERTHASVCDFTTATPHIPILQSHGIIPSESLFEGPSTLTSLVVDDTFPGNKHIITFTSSLVSILLESWVECTSNDILCKGVSIESLPLMENIISILCVLIKLISSMSQRLEGLSLLMVECERIANDISLHILCHFPFSAASLTQVHSSHHALNFTICELIILLRNLLCLMKSDGGKESALMVMKYVSGLNSDDIKCITSSTQVLFTCSKSIVNFTPIISEMAREISTDALKGTFAFVSNFFGACHPQSKSKQLLVKCFSKMFLNESSKQNLGYSSVVMTELLVPWSSTLVGLFLELGCTSAETSSIVMESIATAALHGNTLVISEWHKNLESLFSPGVSFLPQLSELTQRRAVELIWHVPSLEEKELSLLTKSILSYQFCHVVVLYLVQLIHQRFIQENLIESSLSSVSEYLSFMWTILIGGNDCITDCNADSEFVDTGNIILVQSNFSEDYAILQEMVCDCLEACPFSSRVLQCYDKSLSQLMAQHHLSANGVWGILKLGYRFGPQLGDNVLSSSSTVNVFARLCLSVILTATSHDVSNTDQQNLMLMECYKLSYQILGLWQALLEEVLRLFKNSNAATNCHYVKCLVELLNHPIISQKLWKNRLKLKECLQDVKCWSDSTVGIRKELELAVGKFV